MDNFQLTLYTHTCKRKRKRLKQALYTVLNQIIWIWKDMQMTISHNIGNIYFNLK